MSRPLAAGDHVLLIDRKDRRYLIQLSEGGEFHTHFGVVPHQSLIGMAEGTTVRSTKGMAFMAFRPTLADHVIKMPRGAQVVYPKDLGAILMLADIAPGMHVFESGVGSGALSSALLRGGARVTGYEIRADFAQRARDNVHEVLGSEALERYHVELRDSYEGIDVSDVDRIVLDLPEPWQVVKHASRALAPGGILVGYTPSILQAVQLREALDECGFALASTMEVLHRGWHIEGQAVRPDHRMVAHTGFLTSARAVPR